MTPVYRSMITPNLVVGLGCNLLKSRRPPLETSVSFNNDSYTIQCASNWKDIWNLHASVLIYSL